MYRLGLKDGVGPQELGQPVGAFYPFEDTAGLE